MTHATSAHEPALNDGGPPRSAPATRVDKAHAGPRDAIASPAAPDSEAWVSAVAASAAETTAAATIRQVRLQASQLAMHLKRQQAAVDHREAELNARLAAMEKEIRGARLWLNERHEELAHRHAELDRREQELAARETQTTQDRAGITRSANPWNARGDDLSERVAELARREAELDAVARRLADQAGRGARPADSAQAPALAERHKNLDRLEQLIEQERKRLEQERQRLDDERATLVESIEAERRRLAEEGQRTSCEHDKARRELVRQCDEVAARHAALEKLRGDVFRWQQEALETRLATEELWSRLCGTMAPAALMRSLAEIRRKLADNERLARAELAEQKAEIQALADRVAQGHQKLAGERDALRAWAEERQSQMAEHAERVAAAERQIERERAALEAEADRWRRERRLLEDEIRSLLGKRTRAAA